MLRMGFLSWSGMIIMEAWWWLHTQQTWNDLLILLISFQLWAATFGFQILLLFQTTQPPTYSSFCRECLSPFITKFCSVTRHSLSLLSLRKPSLDGSTIISVNLSPHRWKHQPFTESVCVATILLHHISFRPQRIHILKRRLCPLFFQVSILCAYQTTFCNWVTILIC